MGNAVRGYKSVNESTPCSLFDVAMSALFKSALVVSTEYEYERLHSEESKSRSQSL